jgi:hypothetical protein
MLDESLRTDPNRLEVCRGSEQTTPDYYLVFLRQNLDEIVTVIRNGDLKSIKGLLSQFSDVLPQDINFKEMASLIAIKKNGGVWVTTVSGELEQIDKAKVRNLADDLVQAVPLDSQKIMFLHSHPAHNLFGLHHDESIGFSDPDKGMLQKIGGKLRFLPELDNLYASLCTAGSQKVVLNEATNNGQAYGWSFEDL